MSTTKSHVLSTSQTNWANLHFQQNKAGNQLPHQKRNVIFNKGRTKSNIENESEFYIQFSKQSILKSLLGYVHLARILKDCFDLELGLPWRVCKELVVVLELLSSPQMFFSYTQNFKRSNKYNQCKSHVNFSYHLNCSQTMRKRDQHTLFCFTQL